MVTQDASFQCCTWSECRDIKSSNILLTAEGRAKIADVGLAKVSILSTAHLDTALTSLEEGKHVSRLCSLQRWACLRLYCMPVMLASLRGSCWQTRQLGAFVVHTWRPSFL